jgi:uncharacterized protein (TIGR00255 family)
MTGFGSGEGAVAGGRLLVEIRTVNHRFFHLSIKAPSALASLETGMRERLRRDFDRGHVTASIRWLESPERGAGSVNLDLERARDIVARMRELQTTLGIAGEPDLAMVTRQPDVLVAGAGEASEVVWEEVEPVMRAAVTECKAMRRREGDVLLGELLHRLELLEKASAVVAERAPQRLIAERDRLRASVGELLDSRKVDEGRLEQEIAYLADKLDITEELVRLQAHIAACREALGQDNPVGKRLGFLAQEMGREVNTIGSKANDAAIAAEVVAMKGELEKFREQLENIE